MACVQVLKNQIEQAIEDNQKDYITIKDQLQETLRNKELEVAKYISDCKQDEQQIYNIKQQLQEQETNIENKYTENKQYLKVLDQCLQSIRSSDIIGKMQNVQNELNQISYILDSARKLKLSIDSGENIRVTQRQIQEHNRLCSQRLTRINTQLLSIQQQFARIEEQNNNLNQKESELISNVSRSRSSVDEDSKQIDKELEECAQSEASITSTENILNSNYQQLEQFTRELNNFIEECNMDERDIQHLSAKMNALYQQMDGQHNHNNTIIQKINQGQDSMLQTQLQELQDKMNMSYEENKQQILQYEIQNANPVQESISNLQTLYSEDSADQMIQIARSEEVRRVNEARVVAQGQQYDTQHSQFKSLVMRHTKQLADAAINTLVSHQKDIQAAKKKLNVLTQRGKMNQQYYNQQLEAINALLKNIQQQMG